MKTTLLVGKTSRHFSGHMSRYICYIFFLLVSAASELVGDWDFFISSLVLNSCLEIVSIPHRGKSEMKLEVGARRERKVVFTNVKIVKVRRKRLNFSSSFAPKITGRVKVFTAWKWYAWDGVYVCLNFFPLCIAQFPWMAVIAEMECFESETPLFFNPKSRLSAF